MSRKILLGAAPLLAFGWATGCNLLNTSVTGNGPGGAFSEGPGTLDGGGIVSAFTPNFGQTQTLASSPPPVSGGTLLVSKDGATAIAADSDRDQVYLVDLKTQAVTTLALQPGDEPGRLVEDGARTVHVATRSGGVVVDIDIATRQIVGRRAVCGAPRGIDYDSVADVLYVACATGELVTLPASGGTATRSVFVERDLRDVVVVPGTPSLSGGQAQSTIYVSRLKTAELLTIGPTGAIANQGGQGVTPPASDEGMTPGTAWRAIAIPGQSVAVVHQRATTQVVSTQQGGYGAGGDCESAIVESTVTVFQDGTPSLTPSPTLPAAVLPVDLAISPDGTTFAVVAAGNAALPELPSVLLAATGDFQGIGLGGGSDCENAEPLQVNGQPVAVAFTPTGNVIVQTREPAALVVLSGISDAPVSFGDAGFFEDSGDAGPDVGEDAGNAGFDAAFSNNGNASVTISLSSISRQDTGHQIFHSNSGAFIACASCHAEGLEDGRVWTFDDTTGGRRTQSLRGTLQGTAPYHWEGELSDVNALVSEVFIQRMSGPNLAPDQVTALQSWLFALPAPPASSSSAAAQAGSLVFADPAVGCTACHSGAKLTNNATVDVNTGGQFQVPSLVGVAWRAPFLHDGCAATLQDRFSPQCTDGVSHGHTANLSTEQIDDLVAFLQTL